MGQDPLRDACQERGLHALRHRDLQGRAQGRAHGGRRGLQGVHHLRPYRRRLRRLLQEEWRDQARADEPGPDPGRHQGHVVEGKYPMDQIPEEMTTLAGTTIKAPKVVMNKGRSKKKLANFNSTNGCYHMIDEVLA